MVERNILSNGILRRHGLKEMFDVRQLPNTQRKLNADCSHAVGKNRQGIYFAADAQTVDHEAPALSMRLRAAQARTRQRIPNLRRLISFFCYPACARLR